MSLDAANRSVCATTGTTASNNYQVQYQQNIRHSTKQKHQVQHQAKTSGTAPGKDIRHSTRQRHQARHQAKTIRHKHQAKHQARHASNKLSGTAPSKDIRQKHQAKTIRHGTKQKHQGRHQAKTSGTAPGKNIRYSTRQKHQAQHQAGTARSNKLSGTAAAPSNNTKATRSSEHPISLDKVSLQHHNGVR